MTSYDRPVTRALYLALLDEDEASPFLPQSDEEEDGAGAGDGDSGDGGGEAAVDAEAGDLRARRGFRRRPAPGDDRLRRHRRSDHRRPRPGRGRLRRPGAGTGRNRLPSSRAAASAAAPCSSTPSRNARPRTSWRGAGAWPSRTTAAAFSSITEAGTSQVPPARRRAAKARSTWATCACGWSRRPNTRRCSATAGASCATSFTWTTSMEPRGTTSGTGIRRGSPTCATAPTSTTCWTCSRARSRSGIPTCAAATTRTWTTRAPASSAPTWRNRTASTESPASSTGATGRRGWPDRSPIPAWTCARATTCWQSTGPNCAPPPIPTACSKAPPAAPSP